MLNVLVLGKYYPPYRGGTEVYTRDVCEALAGRHRVVAVVFNHERGSRTEVLNGVTVIRCSAPLKIRSQSVSPATWRHTDLAGFDVVHFHAPNFFTNALLNLRLRRAGERVPVVVTHHSDVVGRRGLRALVLPLYHALLRRAHAVVVTSLRNAAISRDIPGWVRPVAVPLGIRLGDYARTAAQRAEAAAWRRTLAGDAPTVGFVGRHARYKGLDVLVRALAAMPGVHGLIAGDGPCRAPAEALAGELGVAGRLHFLGDVSEAEKKRMLAASDVFAFPSTEVTEAFGVSQLEAMAVGVPVVASDLPTGVTDVAIHERTALLVPPGDAAALARALRRVLDDGALGERLVAGARSHLAASFDHDTVVREIARIIEAAADEAGGGAAAGRPVAGGEAERKDKW